MLQYKDAEVCTPWVIYMTVQAAVPPYHPRSAWFAEGDFGDVVISVKSSCAIETRSLSRLVREPRALVPWGLAFGA